MGDGDPGRTPALLGATPIHLRATLITVFWVTALQFVPVPTSRADDLAPSLDLLTPAPAQNALVEFRVADVPLPGPEDNPFDPTEFDIAVTFTGPDGRTLETAAFWHESGEWRARLLAEIPGRWSAVAGRGPAVPFDVAPAPPSSLGVVRRSGEILTEPGGSPYLALGENLGWGAVSDYEEWLRRLGEIGATWGRIWMADWSFGLEWDDTPLGDYRSRLQRAANLDSVLDLAVANGVRIQLVLQHHGPYSTLFNSQWEDNPYNRVNGGPLSGPDEVWTNPTARELFKRRYRYVVSRWWAHPGLLAWELWNEFDLVDGNWLHGGPAVRWHAEMAAYVRSLDPLDRPITTSYASGWLPDDGSVWRIPEIDIVELHSYLRLDQPLWFGLIVPPRLKFGKPVLIAEAGVTTEGPPGTLDPHGDHVFDMAWGGLMSGQAGTGMTWWWDNYVHPRDLYGRLAGAFAFARENKEVLSGARPRLDLGFSDSGLLVAHHVRKGDSGAVWLRGPGSLWPPAGDQQVRGGILLVPADSSLWLRWWDTETGEPIGPAYRSGTSDSGYLVTTAPAFTGSVALTYEPAG